MWRKLGWRTGAVQSTANKLKGVQHSTFCDTFSDVILTDECEVKIECDPRRSFRKVGKPHHNKGQPKHRGFDSFYGETFQSQSNSTCQSISLFGHNLGLLTITKWLLRT